MPLLTPWRFCFLHVCTNVALRSFKHASTTAGVNGQLVSLLELFQSILREGQSTTVKQNGHIGTPYRTPGGRSQQNIV